MFSDSVGLDIAGDAQVGTLFFIIFYYVFWVWVRATLNNISVISWRSFLLVEESGVLGESQQPVVDQWFSRLEIYWYIDYSICSSNCHVLHTYNKKRCWPVIDQIWHKWKYFFMARVWIPFRRGVLNTTLCDKVCQWFAAGRWFSPATTVSSTNKTNSYDNNWNIVESGVKHPWFHFYVKI